MAKKPSLTDALNSASKTTENIEQDTELQPTTSAHNISSRYGKKLISGHFDPDVHRQLKQLSVNQDMTIQDLLGEALEDLFEKHGLSR